MTIIVKSFLASLLMITVSASPFFNQQFLKTPMEQQMVQTMDQLNQRPMEQMRVTQQTNQQLMMNSIIEQQMMDQLVQQNQYNALQQQLMAMQQLHSPYNALNGAMMTNLPPQPMMLLIPNPMTKRTNHLESLPNTKIGNGDTDSVVIEADKEPNVLAVEAFPRAIVVLPNGQRLFIGSIISAIPFLPFEVNVPDTIAWMYNGIAGIIGGIGQRLPFRPKPTEKPDATQTPAIEDISQPSKLNLWQRLMIRKQNAAMPILFLPASQAIPIQVPIEV